MQVLSKEAPGQMTDDERRKKAEDMIMKIAAMMDLGDEDDYGEEDGDDGQSNPTSSAE